MTVPATVPAVAPVLTTDGLLLRPWTTDDADEVLVLADDAETRRWSPSLRGVTTRQAAAAWIARRLARRTDWAVVDTATGRLAARAGLHHHDEQDRAAEIGYGVSPAFRRRRVAVRTVGAVTAWAFTAPEAGGLGLHRVNLHHAVGNAGSCRTAYGAGFAFEGLAREAIDDGAGGFDDIHLHARLATDEAGPIRRAVPPTPVEVAAGAYQLLVADPDRDAADVLAACADPEIRRWNPGPTTLGEARAWCAMRGDWSGGEHASWLVRDAVGGALVGSVSLHQVDAQHGHCEVGYWVAAAARGRGAGVAMVGAATRYAFAALGLVRVEIFHAVDNPASCVVATRAGFALEGTHRQAYRYGDGLLHDDHSHARLATDAGPDDGLWR